MIGREMGVMVDCGYCFLVSLRLPGSGCYLEDRSERISSMLRI